MFSCNKKWGLIKVDLSVPFFVFRKDKDMVKGTFCMNVSAIGTDDGKNTYEIRRKWGEKGKKSLVIEMYPTIEAENCGVKHVCLLCLKIHRSLFGLKKKSTA